MTFYEEGGKYKDAVGREWHVVHAFNSPKNERLLLVKHDMPATQPNLWAIIRDNLDGTATVLKKIDYTTLFAERGI